MKAFYFMFLFTMCLSPTFAEELTWGTHREVIQSNGPHRLITAVQEQDTEKLKTVWTKDLHETFAARGWQKVLRLYETAFEAEGLTEWERDKILYAYQKKDDRSGKITIKYNGEVKGELRVRLQDGTWLLDEN